MIKEQIKLELPWMKQLVSIATELDIDLTTAGDMSKQRWKNNIKEKTRKKIESKIKDEVNDCGKYKENALDKVQISKSKRYMLLSRKVASAVLRARAGVLHPEPRKPYWEEGRWRCLYCLEKLQSTKHYVLHCKGTKYLFTNDAERQTTWDRLTLLDGNDKEIEKMGTKVKKIYSQICKDKEN